MGKQIMLEQAVARACVAFGQGNKVFSAQVPTKKLRSTWDTCTKATVIDDNASSSDDCKPPSFRLRAEDWHGKVLDYGQMHEELERGSPDIDSKERYIVICKSEEQALALKSRCANKQDLAVALSWQCDDGSTVVPLIARKGSRAYFRKVEKIDIRDIDLRKNLAPNTARVATTKKPDTVVLKFAAEQRYVENCDEWKANPLKAFGKWADHQLPVDLHDGGIVDTFNYVVERTDRGTAIVGLIRAKKDVSREPLTCSGQGGAFIDSVRKGNNDQPFYIRWISDESSDPLLLIESALASHVRFDTSGCGSAASARTQESGPGRPAERRPGFLKFARS